MVNFSEEETPFIQDDCCTHERSLGMLKTLMQIDTLLAGFLMISLVGKDYELIETYDEKIQVILQVVTCSTFLAATAHTVVLMVCTGWRYTLTWYDPLFSTVFSALGAILLYITLADAILIRLRPGEDLDTVGYWMVIIFALNLPMALAGPLVTIQMVLHKFPSIRERSETAGSGRELI